MGINSDLLFCLGVGSSRLGLPDYFVEPALHLPPIVAQQLPILLEVGLALVDVVCITCRALKD
jgi:hypothetical protein